MNNVFKLTLTPLFNKVQNINKYKINVEYFNKDIIGAKFDRRNEDGFGFVVFFTKDFIEVTDYCFNDCGGGKAITKPLLNTDNIIEKTDIKEYLFRIRQIEPQIEKYFTEKKREEECIKKAWNNWLQEKPIEYSF